MVPTYPYATCFSSACRTIGSHPGNTGIGPGDITPDGWAADVSTWLPGVEPPRPRHRTDIGGGDFMWQAEIAQTLRAKLVGRASRVPGKIAEPSVAG
jgi:hypothetical protein